jgi:hypothetical protein
LKKKKRGNYTLNDLEDIFGWPKEKQQHNIKDEEFLMNRMNAMTLYDIYGEQMEEIIFNSKIEDKMTHMLYLN